MDRSCITLTYHCSYLTSTLHNAQPGVFSGGFHSGGVESGRLAWEMCWHSNELTFPQIDSGSWGVRNAGRPRTRRYNMIGMELWIICQASDSSAFIFVVVNFFDSQFSSSPQPRQRWVSSKLSCQSKIALQHLCCMAWSSQHALMDTMVSSGFPCSLPFSQEIFFGPYLSTLAFPSY